VVGNLEDVGLERAPRTRRVRQQRPLAPRFDVAGKDERPLAVDDAEHERVVVAAHALLAGPEHLDARPADREGVAGARFGHGNAGGGQRGAKRRIVAVRTGADDRPANAHPREDGVEAADVVRVAVARDDVVEPRDAERPERLADDALADVEPLREERNALLPAKGLVETRAPSRVDEHRLAAREAHERRVALPHVEEDHVEPSVRCRTLGRRDEHRVGGDRRREARGRHREPPP
jgi:hypothetical protein